MDDDLDFLDSTDQLDFLETPQADELDFLDQPAPLDQAQERPAQPGETIGDQAEAEEDTYWNRAKRYFREGKFGEANVLAMKSGGFAGAPAPSPESAAEAATEAATIFAVEAAFIPAIGRAAASTVAPRVLESIVRLTQAAATGEATTTTQSLLKTGELPSQEDLVKNGLQWAAVDAILQTLHLGGVLTYDFGRAVNNIAEKEGVPATKVLSELWDATKGYVREKFGRDIKVPRDIRAEDVEILVDGARELEKDLKRVEHDIDVTPKPEEPILKDVEGKNKTVSTISEEAQVTAKPKELSVKEPPKPKKPKEPPKPITVERKPEDKGKTSSQVVGSRFQTEPHKPKSELSVKKVASFLETKLYNRFAPLKQLGVGAESFLQRPREMAELVRGYRSTAESVLRYAQYDAATMLANGPGFMQIFNPDRLKTLTGKNKLDKTELDKYLGAKASLERQQLGQANPLPTEDAKEFIKDNEAKYEPIAKDLYKFGRNNMRNLNKEGMLSTKGMEAMFGMYKAHVPLYRLMPEELSVGQELRAGLGMEAEGDKTKLGANSLHVAQPVKRARGNADLKILSPLESMVKNTIFFENAMAKNRAMKAVGKGLEKAGYEVKQVGRAKERLPEELEEMMEDLEEDTLDDLRAIAEIVNDTQPKGTVRWMEEGNLWEAKAPKEIVEAVAGLSPQQTNMAMKALGAWKNTFSAGIVLRPDTATRLGLMDFIVSTLQSKHRNLNPLLEIPSRLLYEYPRMFLETINKGPLFQEYMRSGAAQVSLRGLDRDMLNSMTQDLVYAEKTKDPLLKASLKGVRDAAVMGFQFLKYYSDLLSNAPRMLEYERSVQKSLREGLSNKEAMAKGAFEAFEVSNPYGRKGSSNTLNFFYGFLPFVNTIVNSGVSMVKALDPRNPMFLSTVATATIYLTAPTVAEYLKNRNDPRYQALPQQDKDMYVYHYKTNDPAEEPFKMRKMWQYGYLFQTLPEHLTEFMIQRDPKAFDGLMRSFEYEFSPITIFSFSNAVSSEGFDPSKLMEARHSVIPEKQKRIDAELQATSSTTETAKVLAKWFKISPIYIDHLVGMTGGGLGKDVIRLVDEAIYFTGNAVDRRPHGQTADSIFYGTWWGRGPTKRNEYVNKFYEFVDKMENKKNTANQLLNEGRSEEADKKMRGYVDMSEMRKDMAKFYKQIEAIRNEHPDDLDGVKKRKDLTSIYIEMTELAKQFVKGLEEEAELNR